MKPKKIRDADNPFIRKNNLPKKESRLEKIWDDDTLMLLVLIIISICTAIL